MRRRGLTHLARSLVLAAAWACPAGATYSIAAVDQSSQQVGGAITSCVGALDVGVVYASAPGYGVVHAQAQLDPFGSGRRRAVELLIQQTPPLEIIGEITALGFDLGAASRQYGIVDLQGRFAGYTGAQAQAYKHDQQGTSGVFAYSVQGNILTSQRVLDQAAAAFEAQGCDLADRLMLALEAGANDGEGDSRCTGQGIPSDSAFIEVDRADEAAGSYLRLSVSGTAPENPLVPLRQQFDEWRTAHPCPAPAVDAGAAPGGDAGVSEADASSDSSAGGATDPGTSAPDANAGSGAAMGSGGAAGGAGVTGGSAGGAQASAGGGGAPPESQLPSGGANGPPPTAAGDNTASEGGCACSALGRRLTQAAPPALMAGLWLVLLLTRRATGVNGFCRICKLPCASPVPAQRARGTRT